MSQYFSAEIPWGRISALTPESASVRVVVHDEVRLVTSKYHISIGEETVLRRVTIYVEQGFQNGISGRLVS